MNQLKIVTESWCEKKKTVMWLMEDMFSVIAAVTADIVYHENLLESLLAWKISSTICIYKSI